MIKTIECSLHRRTESDEGTFGVFAAPSLGFYCISLEPPPRQNTPMKSHIPAGYYLANWSFSHRFKRDMYRLGNVPSRIGILIHAANFAGDVSKGFTSELSGCIALGLTQTRMTNKNGSMQHALNRSHNTIAEFERLCEKKRLLITITDPVLNPPTADDVTKRPTP